MGDTADLAPRLLITMHTATTNERIHMSEGPVEGQPGVESAGEAIGNEGETPETDTDTTPEGETPEGDTNDDETATD